MKLKDLATLPAAIGARDHVIGASLATGYVASLLATSRSLGFPRDEGVYFHAGREYARWFELLVTRPAAAVQQSAIDGVWSFNHEHPSLMKSLFGISWLLLSEKWHVFKDASDAFRLPGMAMGGLTLWITYLFGARVFGRWAGLSGALLLALMPRVFFHAHLACFDVPAMAMWTLSIYVYWRSLRRGLLWAVAAGIAYGLMLDTKHNAFVMPAVFVPHALVLYGRRSLQQLRVGKIELPASLVAMATLGPLVLVALWPWLWNDTIPRIQEWITFHTHHDYYNMEFLGKNYYSAPSPRGYAPFMIAATVPTITLVLFFVGAWDRLRPWLVWAASSLRAQLRRAGVRYPMPRDPRQTDLLLALSFSAPLAIFVLRPTTPIFGGTKHWMPAYPFLAMLAGHGFVRVAAAMKAALAALPAGASSFGAKIAASLRPGGRAEAALLFVCLLAPLAVTAHAHPFGLSAYVPLVGGTAGGADLGLNRQFWGFTTESVGPWLAENAPRGATVALHDTTWEAWQEMIEEGRLRHDLRAVNTPSEADFALVQHELHMNEIDYQIWVAYHSDAPAYVLLHDGVPIVSVYRRGK